jgi:hypothetical protein
VDWVYSTDRRVSICGRLYTAYIFDYDYVFTNKYTKVQYANVDTLWRPRGTGRPFVLARLKYVTVDMSKKIFVDAPASYILRGVVK